MNTRELAKFFSGFAVAKVACGAALAASNVLPITILGFNITPNCNFWMLIIWAVVAVFLIHYAWFKR